MLLLKQTFFYPVLGKTKVYPQQQIKYERFSATIYCESLEEVIWKKRGRPIHHNRIEKFGVTNIKILNLKSTDSGVYECYGNTETGVKFIGRSELLVGG